MALNATMTWYLRTDGAEANGGGFDPAVSGAGVNYADQAAAQYSGVNLAIHASDSTKVTPGTTSANDIGNVVRISAGTGFTTGYYMITAQDGTYWTLDRSAGTVGSTGGTYKMGGAHRHIWQYASSTVGLPSPALATPIAPGHTIYMRSAGSSANPSIAGTPDYDYSAGYMITPAGDNTTGPITLIGLGASETIPVTGTVRSSYRPLIKTTGLTLYQGAFWRAYNIKTFTSSPSQTTYGFIASSNCTLGWSIHDQNGDDAEVFHMSNACVVHNCWITNSGSTTAGTTPALNAASYFCAIFDNLFTNIRGPAIDATGSQPQIIEGNIVANCHGSFAIRNNAAFSSYITPVIRNNTVYNPDGDGIVTDSLTVACGATIMNNTVSKIASGKFAYKVTGGSTAINDSFNKGRFDYNNAYLDGGAGGLYSGISAGPHDTNLDPGFVDPTSPAWDFTIGANLKAKGLGFVPLP